MADEDMNLSNGTPLNISNASSSNSKEDKPPQNNGDATDWKLDDKVMVRWKDGVCYEAKIIKVLNDKNGQLSYCVSYRNWGKSYNETYSHEDALKKFEDYSPEYAKECDQEYKMRLSGGKKRKASKASISGVTPPPSKRLAIATSRRGSLASSESILTPLRSPVREQLLHDFKTPSNDNSVGMLKLPPRNAGPTRKSLASSQSILTPQRSPVREQLLHDSNTPSNDDSTGMDKLPPLNAGPNRKSLPLHPPIRTPQSTHVPDLHHVKTPSSIQVFRQLKVLEFASSTRESSPSDSEYELSEVKKLFVPNRLRDLALKKCVFPPKLPISDLTKAYIEETKTGRRPTSSLGEYAGRIESVIDCMVNECKTTVQFYLLNEEFPAYFELVNKNRVGRDSLDMDDYVRKYPESKNFPDSQGSFRQTIVKKKIPEKYQPDENALDLVYLLRYVITFGNLIDPSTSSYRKFEPIFTDLLDFIDAALPEDVYE